MSLSNFFLSLSPLCIPCRRSIIITAESRSHCWQATRRVHSRPRRHTMARVCVSAAEKRFHAELSGNERETSFRYFSPFPGRPSIPPRAPPTHPPFSPPFFRTILAFAPRPLLVSLGYIEARLNCRRFSMAAVQDRPREIRSGKTCLYSRPCGSRKERKNRESLSRLQPPR